MKDFEQPRMYEKYIYSDLKELPCKDGGFTYELKIDGDFLEGDLIAIMDLDIQYIGSFKLPITHEFVMHEGRFMSIRWYKGSDKIKPASNDAIYYGQLTHESNGWKK